MYISFEYICRKYGTPKGVIHVGAHLMEERKSYIKCGIDNILWVEANPNIYKSIEHVNASSDISYEKVINNVICDVDDQVYEFNITNNSQSSSILQLERHKIFHPDVYVTEKMHLKSRTIESIIKEEKLDVSKFNFVNLDIQGAELLALKGFGKYLSDVDYIYTEVNTSHVYKDCAIITDIDSYLATFGFVRKETYITSNEWGDALYIKNI